MIESRTTQGIILGGSNSITIGGLSDGIKSILNSVNFAVGGSSSLQNLFMFIKNQELICSSKFIVTESNVNDSFNAMQFGNIELICKNIDYYYHDLSIVSHKCVIILLPIRNSNSKTENDEIVFKINEQHRINAHRYGFHLIDIARVFSYLSDNEKILLMPDSRHPLQIFMYNLGRNIASFMLSINNQSQLHEKYENHEIHFVYSFEEHDKRKGKKENSKFSEEVVEIDSKYYIEKNIGMQVVGVAGWCDGYALMELKNTRHKILKSFNELNSFNEVLEEFYIDELTTIQSLEKGIATEKSVNVPKNLPSFDKVKLIGFLLRDTTFELKENKGNGFHNLNSLIPDVHPYVATMKFYLFKNDEIIDLIKKYK